MNDHLGDLEKKCLSQCDTLDCHSHGCIIENSQSPNREVSSLDRDLVSLVLAEESVGTGQFAKVITV